MLIVIGAICVGEEYPNVEVSFAVCVRFGDG